MLEKLKLLLNIAAEETAKDEILSLLLEMTGARLQNLLGGMEIPESLNHIVIEVAVKRFNRIGSEGFSGHTVEGESITVSEDDFAEYDAEIQKVLDSTGRGGVVRFL